MHNNPFLWHKEGWVSRDLEFFSVASRRCFLDDLLFQTFLKPASWMDMKEM